MIASIRDGLYRKQLQQLAQEVAEDLLGGRRATVLAPEVALAADLLYYAVTTVSGTQTIGEEFVHILRAQRYKVEVKGSSVEMIRPLGTATRVLVCFCQCLMPYLASVSPRHVPRHESTVGCSRDAVLPFLMTCLVLRTTFLAVTLVVVPLSHHI